MNTALVEALSRELARDVLFDEGIEAARNACVAGASVVAAAITAAAYYDNPITGIRALTECMRRLSSLPLEPGAWHAAFRRDGPSEPELAPGFGHVDEAQARAIVSAAERLLASPAAAKPGKLMCWLTHRHSIDAAAGPLNAVGLAALAFTDAGVPVSVAERLFLSWRMASAMEEGALARERGLGKFPFFTEAYRYEGVCPPPRSFDRARLMREVGLSSPGWTPPAAPSLEPEAQTGLTADDVAALPAHEMTALPEMRASAGIAHLGRQVIVHGRDLHHDCSQMSFVHYFLFCATGRWFDETRARVLERLWICSGYPDARIWCNRIAGYMGSARVDPGLSLSAAIAASNSEDYGFRALKHAFRLQRSIPEALPERQRWFERMLEERSVLYGYGRPSRCQDERVGPALQILADAGVRAGPALERAFWLDTEIGRRKHIGINIGAVWAAVALDFGIDELEYEAFMLLMFAPGYAAVYADQRKRAALSFLRGHQTRTSTDGGP